MSNEKYILPLELRVLYLRFIKACTRISIVSMLTFFFMGYFHIIKWWFPFWILSILIFMFLYMIQLANVRCGIVMTHKEKEGVWDCIFEDESASKQQLVVHPVKIDSPVSVGDAVYIYDLLIHSTAQRLVPLFAKRNLQFIESKGSKHSSPPIQIGASIQAVPQEVRRYCKYHFRRTHQIESIQVARLYKTSSSVKRHRDGNSVRYFYVFTTKANPVTIDCGRLEMAFYKPGDMFYLVKFRNKNTYVPIVIMPEK